MTNSVSPGFGMPGRVIVVTRGKDGDVRLGLVVQIELQWVLHSDDGRAPQQLDEPCVQAVNDPGM